MAVSAEVVLCAMMCVSVASATPSATPVTETVWAVLQLLVVKIKLVGADAQLSVVIGEAHRHVRRRAGSQLDGVGVGSATFGHCRWCRRTVRW